MLKCKRMNAMAAKCEIGSASQHFCASPGFSASTAAANWYLYDFWNMIQEIQLSALSFEPQTNNSWFVWGLDLSGSLQGAGGIGGLLASYTFATSNSVRLYTYDANGNVSEMLSALSSELSILAHYEYSPFGETIVATGELAKENPYRFSTKYTDDETKLVYYGYRFLSPDLGRWVNRDPIGERGGRHLYRFLANAVVCKQDALGKQESGWDVVDEYDGPYDPDREPDLPPDPSNDKDDSLPEPPGADRIHCAGEVNSPPSCYCPCWTSLLNQDIHEPLFAIEISNRIDKGNYVTMERWVFEVICVRDYWLICPLGVLYGGVGFESGILKDEIRRWRRVK